MDSTFKHFCAKPPPQTYQPAKLSGHEACESGYKFFKLSCDLILVTWSKGHVVLRVGASYSVHAEI